MPLATPPVQPTLVEVGYVHTSAFGRASNDLSGKSTIAMSYCLRKTTTTSRRIRPFIVASLGPPETGGGR
jgi:hypothetical protein